MPADNYVRIIEQRQNDMVTLVAQMTNCTEATITIKHDDGTFAEYAHLAKDSTLVNLGEKIAAGQTLALSGNTGFSRGPHLHFAVFVTIDGNTRATIPVHFQTPQGDLLLEEGKDY